MKDFLRQNGILLLVIAFLLSVLIGVLSFVMGGKADPLSNLVNTVTAPVRSGIAAAADWVEGAYNYAFRYNELEEELNTLRARVGELEEQVRQGEEASRENEQLRELLKFQTRRRELTTEPVKVTARSTSNWESKLTLSKGSDHGIEAGDCVITETGVLVGIVDKVGLNWSTVSTIINTDTEIGGIVTRTYSAGGGLCPDERGQAEAELPARGGSTGVRGRSAHLRAGGYVPLRPAGGPRGRGVH